MDIVNIRWLIDGTVPAAAAPIALVDPNLDAGIAVEEPLRMVHKMKYRFRVRERRGKKRCLLEFHSFALPHD
jgi:hypothetical protein